MVWGKSSFVRSIVGAAHLLVIKKHKAVEQKHAKHWIII